MKRRSPSGRANPSPAEYAMLGGQAMLAAGIVHSFVKDAASKRLDKKLVKAAAGYRPDVHLAPPTSWVGAPPTLEELANPHAYSRSWDPLKERLLLAFRTGPVPLARGVDGVVGFALPAEGHAMGGAATGSRVGGLAPARRNPPRSTRPHRTPPTRRRNPDDVARAIMIQGTKDGRAIAMSVQRPARSASAFVADVEATMAPRLNALDTFHAVVKYARDHHNKASVATYMAGVRAGVREVADERFPTAWARVKRVFAH